MLRVVINTRQAVSTKSATLSKQTEVIFWFLVLVHLNKLLHCLQFRELWKALHLNLLWKLKPAVEADVCKLRRLFAVLRLTRDHKKLFLARSDGSFLTSKFSLLVSGEFTVKAFLFTGFIEPFLNLMFLWSFGDAAIG